MRLLRYGRHLALTIAAVEIPADRPFRNRSFFESHRLGNAVGKPFGPIIASER